MAFKQFKRRLLLTPHTIQLPPQSVQSPLLPIQPLIQPTKTLPQKCQASSHVFEAPPKEIPDHLVKYSHAEDKYAFLTYFDTIFVIDDSGSMKGKLWKEAADVLRAITPICTSHDKDGIDLYFLNHRSRNRAPAGKGPHGYYGIDRPQEITALFNSVYPHSGTPTGITLSNILSPYVRRCSADGVENVKPINIIVITDGVASDDPDSIIAQFVGELDRLNAPPHQVGIQFFQVGEDKDAGDDLKMLDDLFGSESGKRDMVDSVTWDEQEHDRKLDPTLPKTLSGDTILKIVLGAVIRRLDKLPTQRPTT
ncbi:hypothetical protein TrVGV298_008610 [Trichoderma virens]|nr:hypothetical protein TrVGV298_008610 [Trichoderma virens]